MARYQINLIVGICNVMGLTGCAMVEGGAHSLGTRPFETNGNLAENGWRPASGDAYFRKKPEPPPDSNDSPPSAKWCCHGTARCLRNDGSSFEVKADGWGQTRDEADDDSVEQLITACGKHSIQLGKRDCDRL
jgi:uncharacterized Fe-S cluster protein YjdI